MSSSNSKITESESCPNITESAGNSDASENIDNLKDEISILHQENAYLARRLNKLEDPKRKSWKPYKSNRMIYKLWVIRDDSNDPSDGSYILTVSPNCRIYQSLIFNKIESWCRIKFSFTDKNLYQPVIIQDSDSNLPKLDPPRSRLIRKMFHLAAISP